MQGQIDIVLIGSGSGSTGEAVIIAHQNGLMPHVREIKGFISTVTGAGLLEKAEKLGIKPIVVDDLINNISMFEYLLAEKVKELEVQLLVSAGCRRVIPEIPGVLCINTHPQDPEKHGGTDMVGIEPHLHFLECEIMDLLRRRRATVETEFTAKITSHCCHGNVDEDDGLSPYDFGRILMQVPIPIPKRYIVTAASMSKPYRKEENKEKEYTRRVMMKVLAMNIQEHVLVFERQLVPMFVENAAIQILNATE